MNLLRQYIRLGAAIVTSGIKEHDTDFLNSSWCEELVGAVCEYMQEHSDEGIVLIPLYNLRTGNKED